MNLAIESMAVDFPRLSSHPNRAPFRGVLTLVDTPSDRAPSGAGGHRVLLAREAVERALPSLLGMGLDYAPSLDRHDAQRKVGIITEAEVKSGQWSVISGQCPGRVAQAFRPAMRSREEESALAAEGLPVGQGTSGAKALNILSGQSAGLKPCSTRIVADRASHRSLITDHLLISGFLYARDFPQLMRELRAQDPAEGGRGTSVGVGRGTAGGRGRGTPLGMSYEIADARVDDMAAVIWRVVDFTFTGAAILRSDKAAYRDTWIELN